MTLLLFLQDLAQDPPLSDQDSFRPLIGHLTDQSLCLAAEQRESVLEQLVGQPSAHSSMIAPLPGPPGPPVSLSFDHTGWDSTLSRMIGRLSHQSGSHWPSPGRDEDGGELGRRAALEVSWLDGGPEESRMRPLVGELDESEQHSGSVGKKNLNNKFKQFLGNKKIILVFMAAKKKLFQVFFFYSQRSSGLRLDTDSAALSR